MEGAAEVGVTVEEIKQPQVGALVVVGEGGAASRPATRAMPPTAPSGMNGSGPSAGSKVRSVPVASSRMAMKVRPWPGSGV